MPGRLWRLLRHGLAQFRWALAGLTALVVVLTCVLVIPQWLVRWELGTLAPTLSAAEQAKAINDVRATLLQGIGGAVLILGAYFTYRQLQTSRDQLQITQQGQVTERFTRAIDQLGHAELDVRLGGIYALERIANDSSDDRTTINEVLTAFVRGHATWPPRREGQPLTDLPIEQMPELQVRAPDVQAALMVLARRKPPPTPSGRLDLHASDLRKVSLDAANLRGVRLDGANLQGASLNRANLQEVILDHAELQGASLIGAQLQRASFVDGNLLGAIFDHAQLQGASLNRANLQGASLVRAHLQQVRLVDGQLQKARLDGARLPEARLDRANLQGASLNRANLQGVRLDRANLQGASLNRANLQGVRLNGANLQGASLNRANLQEVILDHAELQGASLNHANLKNAVLDHAQLINAHADAQTIWPTGFDPRRAGVVFVDPQANTAEGLGS